MTAQIWIASLDAIDLAPAHGSFSEAELARAEHLTASSRRHRFLARRWLARSLLASAVGAAPGELTLERRCERCGELHPANPVVGPAAEVWWSASSAGDAGAVALAPWPVGLDLERRTERRRWEAIARRFFSVAEQRQVAGSPDRFLELWTLKEAYLKALGLGLPGGLRSLDCSRLEPADGGWRVSEEHPGWRFAAPALDAGLVAALAVEGPADSIERRRWDAGTEAG